VQLVAHRQRARELWLRLLPFASASELWQNGGWCCCCCCWLCWLLQVRPEEVELIRRDYAANGGWETFLSYEDPRQDVLVGLLRLRQVSSHNQQDRQPELRGRWAPGYNWSSSTQLPVLSCVFQISLTYCHAPGYTQN
jgi:hypothetical protein